MIDNAEPPTGLTNVPYIGNERFMDAVVRAGADPRTALRGLEGYDAIGRVFGSILFSADGTTAYLVVRFQGTISVPYGPRSPYCLWSGPIAAVRAYLATFRIYSLDHNLERFGLVAPDVPALGSSEALVSPAGWADYARSMGCLDEFWYGGKLQTLGLDDPPLAATFRPQTHSLLIRARRAIEDYYQHHLSLPDGIAWLEARQADVLRRARETDEGYHLFDGTPGFVISEVFGSPPTPRYKDEDGVWSDPLPDA